MSTHVARTDMNTFLPKDYVETVSAGKPQHWIRRYLEGSFIQAEGMVYPQFESAVEQDLTYDDIVYNVKFKGWKVLTGSDFGILDPTVLLLAALDPVKGIIYVYDEYVRNRVAVPTHAQEMKRRLAHIPLGALQKMVADPSGARRNINDKKSLFNHYAEYGIYFQQGDNRIETGIMKVYSYLEMGRVKVLERCTETIKEHLGYRYKEIELDGTPDEKPIDKDNHTVDSLRYIIQELPDDPDNLRTVSYGANDFRNDSDTAQAHLPYELRTDDVAPTGVDAWLNQY